MKKGARFRFFKTRLVENYSCGGFVIKCGHNYSTTEICTFLEFPVETKLGTSTTTTTHLDFDHLPRVEIVDKSHVQIGVP